MTGNAAHENALARVYGAAYTAAHQDGDPARAASLIAPVFAQLNAYATPPHPLLAELARLWGEVSAQTPDAPATVVDWGWYAILTAQHLHGPGHHTVCDARQTQATLLACRGEHLTAAELYRLVMRHYQSAGLPAPARGAQADWAAQLHAGGRCSAGTAELTTVWQNSRLASGGRPDAQTDAYAEALVAMLDTCGRSGEARRREHEAFPDRPRTNRQPLPGTAIQTSAALGHAVLCQYQSRCPLAERLARTDSTRTGAAWAEPARTDPSRKIWEDLLND